MCTLSHYDERCLKGPDKFLQIGLLAVLKNKGCSSLMQFAHSPFPHKLTYPKINQFETDSSKTDPPSHFHDLSMDHLYDKKEFEITL